MVALGEFRSPADYPPLRFRFPVLEPADGGAEAAVEKGVGWSFGGRGYEGGFGWGVV